MVSICTHIFDDGHNCGSPALKDSQFCHFHSRAHAKPYYSRNQGRLIFDLGVLESAESVYIAVTHTNHALLNGDIDSKTANAIFRGLTLVLRALHLKAKHAAPATCEQAPLAVWEQVPSPAPSTNVDSLCGADTLVRPEGAYSTQLPAITTAAEECPPERGRTSEPKDPNTAPETTNEPAFLNQESVNEQKCQHVHPAVAAALKAYRRGPADLNFNNAELVLKYFGVTPPPLPADAPPLSPSLPG